MTTRPELHNPLPKKRQDRDPLQPWQPQNMPQELLEYFPKIGLQVGLQAWSSASLCIMKLSCSPVLPACHSFYIRHFEIWKKINNLCKKWCSMTHSIVSSKQSVSWHVWIQVDFHVRRIIDSGKYERESKHTISQKIYVSQRKEIVFQYYYHCISDL